jgi:hypothetical protein
MPRNKNKIEISLRLRLISRVFVYVRISLNSDREEGQMDKRTDLMGLRRLPFPLLLKHLEHKLEIYQCSTSVTSSLRGL